MTLCLSELGRPPGHSRVTHSRHRAVISGNQRTRRRRDWYSGGAWRVREELVGHAAETVRDREAEGSNPSPPTKF
jgi:hypothetical protein